jgi:uncharacterized membrane protein (GlpM family)
MHQLIKVLLVVLTVVLAGTLGQHWPVVGGILVSAPLKIPFAAWWVFDGSGGDRERTCEFLDGALWGLIPTALFVLVALVGLRRGCSMRVAFGLGFAIWFMAAVVQERLQR